MAAPSVTRLQVSGLLAPSSAPSLAALIATSALQAVAKATDTVYQHVSDIDPSRGRFHTDCSGFVSWLLETTAPELLQAVKENSPQTGGRLRAWQFHDAFDAAPILGQPCSGPLSQITRAADLGPGDIIATKNPRHMPNSGHVMIAVSAALPVVKAGRIVAYAIRVVDSTATPHEADSRGNGKTGLGSGVIALGVDARGEVSGYYRHGYDPKGPSLIDHDIEGGRAVDRIAIVRPHVRGPLGNSSSHRREDLGAMNSLPPGVGRIEGLCIQRYHGISRCALSVVGQAAPGVEVSLGEGAYDQSGNVTFELKAKQAPGAFPAMPENFATCGDFTPQVSSAFTVSLVNTLGQPLGSVVMNAGAEATRG